MARCITPGDILLVEFKYLKMYKFGAKVDIICSPHPVGTASNLSKF